MVVNYDTSNIQMKKKRYIFTLLCFLTATLAFGYAFITKAETIVREILG